MQASQKEQLIEENGNIRFVLENNSAQCREFLKKVGKYNIKRYGGSLYFHDQNNNQLIAYFNSFDNTFFVCDPGGYDLAAQFGTKQFPIGNARFNLNDQNAEYVKAIMFARDFSFPLESSQKDKAIPFKVVGLPELLRIKQERLIELYENLAELFNRCSDFALGKKEEYLMGGKLEDIYCRFNLDALSPTLGVVTDHVFLLDNDSKIIGTISASIRISENGNTDIYLYDEIVDYHTRLTIDQKHELERLYADSTISEEMKKTSIAAIVDPARLALMEPLFTAARHTIRASLMRLHPKNATEKNLDYYIELGLVRAFIRAAEGQVENHQSLNCKKAKGDDAIYVIHGPRTVFGALVDTHVKAWASQELQLLTSRKTLESVSDIPQGRWVANKPSSPRMYAESSSFSWEWDLGNQRRTPDVHP